ncbi:MAG: membrane protein insertion efficiency factor YidD [Proteobacteria bacterium]|nr:membrane protein insertion efficiency factor YidD [Pseudomonadota bacterium]
MTRLILGLIALYRRLLSPWLGSRCRFSPSCSEYAHIAIARFGATRGGLLAIWRLLRCQPFSTGGIDEVPQTFTLCKSHAPSDAGAENPHE